MQKSLFAVCLASLFVCAALTPKHTESLIATAPLTPNTGVAVAPPVVASNPLPPSPDYPVKLIIPSIALKDTIKQVGLTADGQMAVPAGNTKNVGWYKFGTVPGEIGNSVLDAHVFAAFSKLTRLTIGNDIYVQTTGKNTLHFVVTDVETYPLAEVPVDLLFGDTDGKHLNLITCAGKLTPDHKTYDHRLIVYTSLVENS